MTEQKEVDIFADENEPRNQFFGNMYRVGFDKYIYATLRVADDGYCDLWDWYWFGLRDPHRGYKLSDPEDHKLWDAMQNVWTWLREWEFVELKPIGPEDSEYFATERLTNATV